MSDNAAQAVYWNEQAGPRWVAAQARTDALFDALTKDALDFAAPKMGEAVLDIGCGCGATVLGLGGRVGTGGSVLGVDISAPMLAVAARRVREAGLAQATLLEADAMTHAFAPAGFDLAFSRFGVMFFADPVRAFANIRAAMRPGGRLAFVTFANRAANLWVTVPSDAARPFLPPAPSADEPALGQFAFADPTRVHAILTAAGWSDVAMVPHVVTIQLGELDRAMEQAMALGPLGREAAGLSPSLRSAVEAAVRTALASHATEHGVALPAALWLVAASA